MCLLRGLAFTLTMKHLAAIFALLVLTACANSPANVRPSVPASNPAPAIAEGAKKDEDIAKEANGIAANSADAPYVVAAASRIMDILRLSPWAKTEATIRTLMTERDAALSAGRAHAKIIADLRAQLEKANQKTDQLIRLSLAGFGAILIAGGVIIAVLAVKAGGIFVGVGPMQAGAIGAAGGVLIFTSFAYGWALRNQTLVMGIFAALLVAAAVFWISNHRHAKSSDHA